MPAMHAHDSPSRQDRMDLLADRVAETRDVAPSSQTRDELTDDLFALAHATDGLGDTVSRDCMGFVVELHMSSARRVAHRYAGRGVPEEDLQQIAYLALTRATTRFDPSLGHAFAAFAAPSMSGEIKRHFRDNSWSIRPPRRMQEVTSALVRTGADLSQQSRTSVETLASQVGASDDEVREALVARSGYTTGSVDAEPSWSPMAGIWGDQVAHEGETDDRLLVAGLLATLSEREREIIDLRFTQGLSQQAIAERLGVSQVQGPKSLLTS